MKKNKDELWAEGGFFKPMSAKESVEKNKTFHMKHDEDVNYDCKKCRSKISAHNRDWHDNMCDKCFNKTYFPEEEQSKLG